MKVWITKYALTKGIIEVDAEITEGKWAHYPTPWGFNNVTPHWKPTREEALAEAVKLRDAEIKSHERAIKRLKTMTFKVVTVDRDPDQDP